MQEVPAPRHLKYVSRAPAVVGSRRLLEETVAACPVRDSDYYGDTAHKVEMLHCLPEELLKHDRRETGDRVDATHEAELLGAESGHLEDERVRRLLGLERLIDCGALGRDMGSLIHFFL